METILKYNLDNLFIVLVKKKMSLVLKYATVWCHRGAIKKPNVFN